MKHISKHPILESSDDYSSLPIHGKEVYFLNDEEIEMIKSLNLDGDDIIDTNVWNKNVSKVHYLLDDIRFNFYRHSTVYMQEVQFFKSQGVFKTVQGDGVKYLAIGEHENKKPGRDTTYELKKRTYITANTEEGTNNFLVRVEVDKRSLSAHIGKDNIPDSIKKSFSYGVNKSTQVFSLYFIANTPVYTVGELANLIHETCNTTVVLDGPIEDLNFKLGNDLKLHSIYDGYVYQNLTLGTSITSNN